MKKTNLIFLFVLVYCNLFASEYLRIGDVRSSTLTEPGSIQNASIFIEPKGLFAECQMVLDFSTNCSTFTNPQDSLEIQMNFSLPAAAEVTDLWLWINGLPVQANILDRWTASQVYNGIVQRRTDPALLVKQSATDYELRVFPLSVNLPRKIKMVFLIPINNLTTQPSVYLPLNIVKLSECPISSTRILYKSTQNLGSPFLIESSGSVFTLQNDPDFGSCLVANLSSPQQLNSLTMKLTNSSPLNYFAGIHPNPSGGTYQIEMNPSEIFQMESHKKTVFLIDFIKSNSTISRNEVLQNLKKNILLAFSNGDSINLMFSGLFTINLSNSWLPADTASLNQLFNLVDTTSAYFTNFSNLSALAIDGINFIKTVHRGGNVVLISSSNSYSNSSGANNLANTITNFIGTDTIAINTINLDDQSNSWWGWNNTYYRGNDYLFTTLSALTQGEFQTYSWNNSYLNNTGTHRQYDEMLTYLFPKLCGHFSAYNLYISFQSGLSYAYYDVDLANGFLYFNSPIKQVGKFAGSSPITVALSAQTPDGQVYDTIYSISSSEITATDSVTETIWSAQQLRELAGYNQTPAVVYQMINLSLVKRVLCTYTAFLALESGVLPPDTINYSFTPNSNFGGTVAVSKPDKSKGILNEITIYPNPVKEIGNFKFNLTQNTEIGIQIFNLLGEKVDEIPSIIFDSGEHALPISFKVQKSGIYFYNVFFNGTIYQTGKIVLLK